MTSSPGPNASNKCARCGAPLPSDADASQPCARCLMRVGMEPSSAGGQRAPAPSLAELQPHFPRLELLALVGEGGMGAVYKARDKELDRFVALKVLTVRDEDGVPGSAEFDERFAREARAMARLAHPNIAAVHDHGKAGPWSYLVLEYVDGENLRRVMRTRAVRPSEALRWVGEICNALQYAHENGVVHRDIKPENVLVDAKGRVKVVDFGLAKLLDRRPGEATLTHSRQSLGTWHYMAPEQYERPQIVDHRADIYSLGVVLYELLTGQVPVGRFDLPSQRVEIDVRVDEVVMKALAREPEKRWQAAGDVRRRVEHIERGPEPAQGGGATARRPSIAAIVLTTLAAFVLFSFLAFAALVVAAPGDGASGLLVAIGLLLSVVGGTAGVGVGMWLRRRRSGSGTAAPDAPSAPNAPPAPAHPRRSWSPLAIVAAALGTFLLLVLGAFVLLLMWVVPVRTTYSESPTDITGQGVTLPPSDSFLLQLLFPWGPLLLALGAAVALVLWLAQRKRNPPATPSRD